MHHLKSWTGPPETDGQPETKHDEAQVTWLIPFRVPPIPVSSRVPELSHTQASKAATGHSTTLGAVRVVVVVTGMRPARKNVAHHQQVGSYQQYCDEIMIKICVVHMHSDYYLTILRQMMKRKHVLLFGMISCVSSHTNMHQIVELATHGNLQKRNFWVDEKVDDLLVSTLVTH